MGSGPVERHVLGHQTIGPNVHMPSPAPVSQQEQAQITAFITEEGGLSAISTLRHVMWPAGAITLALRAIRLP